MVETHKDFGANFRGGGRRSYFYSTVLKVSFFFINFEKNFECQVGGGGQQINFFVGVRGIKFEFWWG